MKPAISKVPSKSPSVAKSTSKSSPVPKPSPSYRGTPRRRHENTLLLRFCCLVCEVLVLVVNIYIGKAVITIQMTNMMINVRLSCLFESFRSFCVLRKFSFAWVLCFVCFSVYVFFRFLLCSTGYVCHGEGRLLMCDADVCTRVAHPKCVGLREIPEGDWFCDLCLVVNLFLACFFKLFHRCFFCFLGLFAI